MNQSSESNPDDLGPMPEPEITPPEPNPGGADAQPPVKEVLNADLPPETNASVSDDLPEALESLEDTSTAATRGEEDVSPEEDSPA